MINTNDPYPTKPVSFYNTIFKYNSSLNKSNHLLSHSFFLCRKLVFFWCMWNIVSWSPINLNHSPMYEITAKRKQAWTSISLKSGPFPLKFSEILQVHSKNNRSLTSGLTLISIPVIAMISVTHLNIDINPPNRCTINNRPCLLKYC